MTGTDPTYGPLLLRRCIAVGSISEVHVAEVPGQAGFLALKRLRPHLVTDELARRLFVEEAHVGERARHANLVALRGAGEVGQSLYVVMEPIDGISLLELSARATDGGVQLPDRFLAHVIAEAAAALGCMHGIVDERGQPVVHRAFWPGSVLIARDGSVKVCGFGVRAFMARWSLGASLARASYQPPELAELPLVDARADVFALSAVLWEALARMPFASRRITDDPISAHPLAAFIAWGLAAHEARPLDARLFRDALSTAAKGLGPAVSGAEVGAVVRALLGEIDPSIVGLVRGEARKVAAAAWAPLQVEMTPPAVALPSPAVALPSPAPAVSVPAPLVVPTRAEPAPSPPPLVADLATGLALGSSPPAPADPVAPAPLVAPAPALAEAPSAVPPVGRETKSQSDPPVGSLPLPQLEPRSPPPRPDSQLGPVPNPPEPRLKLAQPSAMPVFRLPAPLLAASDVGATAAGPPGVPTWARESARPPYLLFLLASFIVVAIAVRVPVPPRPIEANKRSSEKPFVPPASQAPPVQVHTFAPPEVTSGDEAPSHAGPILDVVTDPPGATIVVDGQALGRTPFVSPARAPVDAVVALEVRMKGFRTQSRMLDAKNPADWTLRLTLEPERSKAQPEPMGSPDASGHDG
ncbi:MAG: protein kinase [Deltaproteobacteria bacterium]|nr:protein kinase [Deltaproteobacteria bacterium]